MLLAVSTSCNSSRKTTYPPNPHQALSIYAEAIESLDKNNPNAMDLLKRAIAFDSSLVQARTLLAGLYIGAGDFRKAQRTLLKGNAPDSLQSDRDYLLGHCAFELRQYNAAVLYFGSVSDTSRYFGQAQYGLAQIHAEWGNLEQSIEILDRILSDTLFIGKEITAMRDNLLVRNQKHRISGRSDDFTRIQHAQELTRADLAILFREYFGNVDLPMSRGHIILKDVDSDDSSSSLFQWLVSSGLMDVLPDRTFRPGYILSKLNLAYYVHCASELAGVKLQEGAEVVRWNDVPVGHPHRKLISSLVHYNILEPDTDVLYGADRKATGAECILALEQVRELTNKSR